MTTPPEPPPSPAPPAPGAGPPPTPGGTPPPGTADVNALLAAERRHAGSRATEAVLQRLGFATVEEAEAAIRAQRDAETARMSEAERREQAAQEAQRRADAALADAAERTRVADVRTALLGAGCALAAMDDAAVLVAAALPGGQVDAQALADAVTAIKTRRPEMFASAARPASDPGRGPAPGGTGGRSGTGLGRQYAERYGYTKAD